MKTFSFLLSAILVVVWVDFASAQVFRDQMIDGSGWGVNATADTTAEFGYDYSADGIPEAPNSRVGDVATSGLKLTANNGDLIAAPAWQTLYPLGQYFSGNHLLRFDAWMNYDAVEFNEGAANGTTEFLGGGIGYDNMTVDVGVGAQAIATGDGGSGSDWRVYDPAFVAAAQMYAGSRNGADPHYSAYLAPVDTPAAQGQIGLNPPQQSTAGSPGFQWITWTIVTDDLDFKYSVWGPIADGNVVAVFIEKKFGGAVYGESDQPGWNEDLLIAVWDPTVRGTTTDGNISLFYGDFSPSITPRPDLTFGIIDNVAVYDIEHPNIELFHRFDFNSDGVVDTADYVLWRSDANRYGGNPWGYDEWRLRFGLTAANSVGTTTSIPEPATVLLIFLAALFIPSRRLR